MNEFLKRSLTGIIYVAVLLAGTLIHPLTYVLIFGAIFFFTLNEYLVITAPADTNFIKWPTLVTGVFLFIICFIAASGITSEKICLLALPAILILFTVELFRKESDLKKNSAISAMGLVYITVPFGVSAFLVFPGTTFYPWILAGLFFIIWISDSMAYVGGSLLGKHKFAKNISPNKSWEGLLFGIVFAVIAGILNAVLFPSLSMLNWIIVSIIAFIFGTLGDLFESKIKRTLGIKDSGTILPGHGGLLDRLDSLLFALPAVYTWLMIAGNI